jgi:putative chitinase
MIRHRLSKVSSPPSSWKGATAALTSGLSLSEKPQTDADCAVDEEEETVYQCAIICVSGDTGDDCKEDCAFVTKCVEQEQEQEDSPTGGGGDQTGDDPSGCNYDGETSDRLCDDGPPPTGGAPVDTDQDDLPCDLSASELEDGYYLFDQASDSAKSTFIETLEEQGDSYGLDSKEDVKHFIAQTAHESGGKITAVETAGAATSNITRKELLATEWVGPNAEYSIDEVMGNDELMTNIDRANKLGNGPPSSGDGWTYRGRGPLQLTWKGAYRNFTNHYQDQGLGSTNFVDNPEKLSNNARIGTLAALWYWENRVLPKVDGDLTVKKLTLAINGGTTGLQDRKNQFEAAKDAINCDS